MSRKETYCHSDLDSGFRDEVNRVEPATSDETGT